MTWRFYAQRQVTGDWLHTDVPLQAKITRQLNGSGLVAGVIPAAFDVDVAEDGRRLWVERGTTLYGEEDGDLKWVGLCSFQQPTPTGRRLEFRGLSSLYDLVGYDGLIREWQPDPFDVVRRMVNNANDQPDGDVDLHVVEDGKAPTFAGDEQPPTERPEKVKRRRGESAEHFADRQEDRAKEQAQWDRAYGDRKQYTLAWWEAPYIGDELRDLAREIPFDWWEEHRWANRGNLERRSELHLSPRRGATRHDTALVEGINIAEVLDPTTDVDRFGNHVVMLGAGEGRKMRRAAVGARDGRVRTTRFGQAKHVHNDTRLRALARERYGKMAVSVKLDEATVRGDLGGVELGDQVRVESTLFTGWCRVHAITADTASSNLVLGFVNDGGTV